MIRRLKFWWSYFRNAAPWDTGVTPPEIVALAQRLKPGRALDLGCGTGTNVLYLVERGWQAVGVDFVPTAIRKARHKARLAGIGKDRAEFYVGDVTRLGFLSGLFDFGMDIGCFHGLDEAGQHAYVGELARLLRPDAVFALYAFFPRELDGRKAGLTPDEVRERFSPAFIVESVTQSTDTARGWQSAWYEMRRAWPPTFG